MKKVLLVALSLLMITPVIYAQDKDQVEEVKIVLVKEENSDNYYYEGIVPVEGITKEEMFKRAKEWVLSNFKTGDNNAQFDDEELSIFNSPTIVLPKFKSNPGDFVNFKLKLLFKDGKYKFRFDNLTIKSNTNSHAPIESYNAIKMSFEFGRKKYHQYIVGNTNKALATIAADLENAIKKTGNKKDDW